MITPFIKEIEEYIKKYEKLLLSSKNPHIRFICQSSKNKKSPKCDEKYPT